MDWDFFFRQLEAGMNIDETCFYFKDDPNKYDYYLGYLPQYEEPYWVGGCDIEGGCSFKSATELVDAPIFDGKTFREQWNNVVIYNIEGCGIDDWLQYFEHM